MVLALGFACVDCVSVRKDKIHEDQRDVFGRKQAREMDCIKNGDSLYKNLESPEKE